MAAVAPPAGPVLIKDLILRYWTEHATEHYQKRGKPTSEAKNIRTSLKYLRRRCGETAAARFDQVILNTYRDELIDVRHSSIKTVNTRVNHVREMFRWAAEKKIVPAAVWHELLTLKNLRPGRTRAKPGKKVLPVPDQVIEQTLPHLSPLVADIVRFIRLTGCRPGEPLALRPSDIVRPTPPRSHAATADDAPVVLPLRPPPAAGAAPIGEPAPVEVWFFRPEGHKTEHHGKERRVYIGPRAQAILQPYLERDPEGFCFGQGSNGRPYCSATFAKAIKRGLCKLAMALGHKLPEAKKPAKGRKPKYGWMPKRAWFEAAGVPYWHPNQTRHTAATEMEAGFEPDAARVVLGHGDVRTTRAYAERDFAKAEEVARQIG
jgi:integrase